MAPAESPRSGPWPALRVALVAACAVSPPAEAVAVQEAAAACTAASGPFPRELSLPGAEPNGAFDADLARGPDGRLWIAYSGVTGPAGSGLVSTHLAYSDDDGTTWCEQGVVNAAEVVPESEQPRRIAMPEGHWNHEVPALAWDPAAPPERRWTLVWHRYLHVADRDPATDDRHFEHGWIAIRSAATPEGLAAAPERKLFSSVAYHLLPEVEAYNEAMPGGSPEKRWDGDPDLGDCIVFTEPALLAQGGELHAALFCARGPRRQDVVLVGRSPESGEWSYRGTLLTTADAAAIAPVLAGFNAPDLYARGGETRLLVSPTTGIAYLGCLDYGVELAAGTLTGAPVPVVARNPDPAIFQTGACTWAEGAVTGVVAGDTHLTGVQFRLVATGRAP